MPVQIKKWRNDREIRRPRDLAKSFHHKTLEERATEFDGKILLDSEYNWDKPVGREIW